MGFGCREDVYMNLIYKYIYVYVCTSICVCECIHVYMTMRCMTINGLTRCCTDFFGKDKYFSLIDSPEIRDFSAPFRRRWDRWSIWFPFRCWLVTSRICTFRSCRFPFNSCRWQHLLHCLYVWLVHDLWRVSRVSHKTMRLSNPNPIDVIVYVNSSKTLELSTRIC